MKSLQGQLLIASPDLLDPSFVRTVILMIQHGDEGALGLVLNRPTNLGIREAWAQVSQTPCRSEERILRGGPCDGPLMVVHTVPALGQVPVVPGVYFSTDEEKIEQLVELNATPARFFVGYAGWAPGQVEDELKSDSWLLLPANIEQVFGESDAMWDRLTLALTRRSGFPFVAPHLMPRDPTMN